MSELYEKLAYAYEEEKHVTVTETDGTVHQERIGDDFIRAPTTQFEVWRFGLQDLHGETTLFGPDPQSVELLD